LDKIGGVSYYGLIDTYELAREENLLPIGLAFGARVKRAIGMDEPIKVSDVEIKPSTILTLRTLQNNWMDGKLTDDELFEKVNAVED
jgi:predicted homoserine dehydrogenase-like protein